MIPIAAESTPLVSNGLVYLLGAILGGGAITGVTSWIKLAKQGKYEKEEIISRAAEQAVNALRLSLVRLETELESAKDARAKLEELLTHAISDRAKLEAQVQVLNTRIIRLEREISQYRELVPNSAQKIEIIRMASGQSVSQESSSSEPVEHNS